MLDTDLRQPWVHLCVDMQSLFADETPWHAPWLNRILPAVEALSERTARHTIFTRFLPPETPDHAHGAWRTYYSHWSEITRSRQPAQLYDLVPSLKRFVPPARIFGKPIYSPWLSGELHRKLRSEGVSTLIVSGGETDVCVLTTVLGAIDLGYRVIIPTDAIYGSADTTHDATLAIYHNRFQMHLTTTTVDELQRYWKDAGL